ncbi:MAG: hypothetical protein JWM88_687 [Verrucomicrobia bacterium]|nr:hypothetical protein [Verrucomicrobiota bacterium]
MQRAKPEGIATGHFEQTETEAMKRRTSVASVFQAESVRRG